MRKQFFGLMLGCALAIFAIGCDKPSTPEAKGGGGGADAHGHEHGDEGHEDGDHGHDHGHEAPHGGTIVEWGDHEFHVEFVVDHEKQQATAYLLRDDVKTPMPLELDEVNVSIKEPAFQIALQPQPLDGEEDGMCSRFVGTHENFGKDQPFEGAISAVIDDTPYSGNFKEEPHDHADEQEQEKED